MNSCSENKFHFDSFRIHLSNEDDKYWLSICEEGQAVEEEEEEEQEEGTRFSSLADSITRPLGSNSSQNS